MKRWIAYGAGVLVALGVVWGAWMESRREETWDPRLPQRQLPIVLTVDANMGQHASALAEAVDLLHAEVGCPLFVIDSERRGIRVTSLGESPCRGYDTGPGTEHMSFYACDDGSGQITVRDANTPVLDFFHELGHVAGLGHDDTGGSIMNSPPQYNLWPRPGLSEKDVAALRGRYCREVPDAR